MRYPVDKRIVISSHIPFGQPDPNARFGRHTGDDSANNLGTPVYAPASGTITPFVSGQNQGKVVEVFDGKNYISMFHLDSIKEGISPNVRVTEGQLVGYVGKTGLASGYHLHTSVAKRSYLSTTSFDELLDPVIYLTQGDDMFEGKTAEQWAQAAKDATAIAEARKLKPGEVDKIFKMGLQKEPTSQELDNPDYQNDPRLCVNTVWNNGGGSNYDNRDKSYEVVRETLYRKK